MSIDGTAGARQVTTQLPAEIETSSMTVSYKGRSIQFPSVNSKSSDKFKNLETTIFKLSKEALTHGKAKSSININEKNFTKDGHDKLNNLSPELSSTAETIKGLMDELIGLLDNVEVSISKKDNGKKQITSAGSQAGVKKKKSTTPQDGPENTPLNVQINLIRANSVSALFDSQSELNSKLEEFEESYTNAKGSFEKKDYKGALETLNKNLPLLGKAIEEADKNLPQEDPITGKLKKLKTDFESLISKLDNIEHENTLKNTLTEAKKALDEAKIQLESGYPEEAIKISDQNLEIIEPILEKMPRNEGENKEVTNEFKEINAEFESLMKAFDSLESGINKNSSE